MKILIRLSLSLLVGVAIAACGFHLRKDPALPSSLQPIFIGGSAGNGAFAQALRYQLTNSNTTVTPRSIEANYQLLLTGERTSQRIISLDSRGLAAEYGITLAIEFELVDKSGQRVLGPQTIEERRTITNNPDNALTTSQDIALVQTDMYQVLATQVVRRLGAYANHQHAAVRESASAPPATVRPVN